MNLAIKEDAGALKDFLVNFNSGEEVLQLEALLANCKIEKNFEAPTFV